MTVSSAPPVASRARSGWRLPDAPLGDWVPVALICLVIGLLVLPPLVVIIQTSLTERGGALTFDHYRSVFGALHLTGPLVFNSLAFSGGSAFLALAFGTGLAWLAERTNAPFRGAVYTAAFVSFAIPAIIKVIGWILLLGPRAGVVNVWLRDLFGLAEPPINLFSLGGMIVLEALLWTPLVFLLMSTPFRSMDAALEDASSASGAGNWTTFRKVTFRLALPSALAVLLLTFARSLEAFDIPALIGIPAGISVFTTEIYLQTKKGFLPSYGEASAYAVVLIAIVGLALYPYHLATRESQRFATITGKGFRPRVIDLGRWRLLGGACMLVLPALVLMPFLILVWASLLPYFQAPSAEALKSLTLSNYPAAFSNTNVASAVSNSLFVSLIAASGTVVLALLAAWLSARSRSKHRWLIDQLATLPLVFPGIVLGIAVLRLYLALPLPIYGTLWILIIAYVTRFLPYGMRYCHSGIVGIHRDLEECAAASGATWWSVMRRIIVPLMMPALFAGWINIFLITVRELSVAILLYSPGTQLISITFWELWQNGQVPELAAFSIVVCGGLVALSMVFHRMSERYGYRGV
ncbi:MAG: ABC transporter permease [Chloroflexota bacterium]